MGLRKLGGTDSPEEARDILEVVQQHSQFCASFVGKPWSPAKPLTLNRRLAGPASHGHGDTVVFL